MISKLFKFTVHMFFKTHLIPQLLISKLFKFTVHDGEEGNIQNNKIFQNFSSLQFIFQVLWLSRVSSYFKTFQVYSSFNYETKMLEILSRFQNFSSLQFIEN